MVDEDLAVVYDDLDVVDDEEVVLAAPVVGAVDIFVVVSVVAERVSNNG